MTQSIDVLVIRGAPGTGKSTLGRGLRRELPIGAVLEVDDFRSMLVKVDWSSRDHHDVALDAALSAMLAYLAHQQQPVVLIDTFSRSRLTSVLRQLEETKLVHQVLSLWLDPSALAGRLISRSSGFKDWEPSRILNDEVRENRYPNEVMVDVSSLDRDEVVGYALSVISKGAEAVTK